MRSFLGLNLTQYSPKHTFQPRVVIGCLPLLTQSQTRMIAHKALNLFFIFLNTQGAGYVGKFTAGLQQARQTLKYIVLYLLVLAALWAPTGWSAGDTERLKAAVTDRLAAGGF